VYRRQDRGDRVQVVAYPDDAAFLDQVSAAAVFLGHKWLEVTDPELQRAADEALG